MKQIPILLDTNLLILFLVGSASRDYIAIHKKLTSFDCDDYDELLKIIRNASDVFVTPNTLTETSNLAGYIKEPAKSNIFKVFREMIKSSIELFIPSAVAAQTEEFIRLGLTDAAILNALTNQELVVLTTDLDLYVAALSKGKAINFNHLRNK